MWSDYDDYLTSDPSSSSNSETDNSGKTQTLVRSHINLKNLKHLQRITTNNANNNEDDNDGASTILAQQSPNNERRGSVFTILCIPRRKQSNSSSRRKSESSTEHQDNQKPVFKIVQPTRDHMIAAGGDSNITINTTTDSLNGTTNNSDQRRSRSFSNLPPKIILDEENGYVSEDDDYTNRDVSCSKKSIHNGDNSGAAADADNLVHVDENNHSGGDYFHNCHNRSYDNNIQTYQPQGHDEENKSDAASHHVAIDKHIGKIMGTDTDYESDNNHDHDMGHHHDFTKKKDAGYVPESILKKSPNIGNSNDSDADHSTQSMDEKVASLPEDGSLDEGELEEEEEGNRESMQDHKVKRKELHGNQELIYVLPMYF